MRALGVDPGLSATGYGVVELQGRSFRLLEKGTVRTKPKDPLPERLWRILTALEEVSRRHEPQLVAVEEVFLAKNLTAGMLTAQVAGVVKLLARGRELRVYSPREVKKRITGNGAAPKEQVIGMVEHLLGIKGLRSDHAADALALALCAVFDRG
ncbi:crossover junction endodeoxyribonuclease RuvC [Candidatus Bipolaricaulota bacterium]|nr:crossover junction endodeoxyribonuclease RuvC [Candidatus Bipolaricaulota bacterium]